MSAALRNWLLLPIRFVATAYRVLHPRSGFFPLAPSTSHKADAESLQPVSPGGFFAFSLLLPWRALDALLRWQAYAEHGWPTFTEFLHEFFALAVSVESLLSVIVVPIGMAWAWQYQVVSNRVCLAQVTYRDAWTAVAYVMGAGFAAFFLLMMVGIPIAAAGAGDGTAAFIALGLMSFTLLGLCVSALGRSTGQDETEVYIALVIMLCVPFLFPLFFRNGRR